jgi:hypothetical protein
LMSSGSRPLLAAITMALASASLAAPIANGVLYLGAMPFHA